MQDQADNLAMPMEAHREVDARQRGGWLLAIALIAVGLTAGIFSQPGTPFDGYDWLELLVFHKHTYREALLAGHLPLWNPYVALGRPFLADIETATLYPPNLVFLLPDQVALPLCVALHLALILAGGGMLGRDLGLSRGGALLGGVTFALSAAVTHRLQAGQVQVFCTLAHMPLAWALAWRAWRTPTLKTTTGFAAVLAHAILAGGPPFLWAMICTIGVWLVAWSTGGTGREFRRGVAAMVAGGLLAGGLAAVQLVPFIELLGQGNRIARDPQFAAVGPLPWRNLASLFVPAQERMNFFWEMNLFAGILAPLGLVVVVAAWRNRLVRAFTVAAAVGLALALPLGITEFLAQWVPGLGALRLPTRYTFAVGWMLASVALIGGQQTRMQCPRWAWWTLAVAQVGTLLVAVRLHAGSYGRGSIPMAETKIAAEVARLGATAPGPVRTALARDAVRANSGELYGFSNLNSFANPGLARTWEAMHTLAGAPPEKNYTVSGELAAQPREALRRWGVQFSWEVEQARFLFEPNAGPLAQAMFAAEAADSPKAAAAGWWREPGRVWLERGDRVSPHPVDNALSSTTPAHALKITRSAPEMREVAWTAAQPGWLVLADPWYPGWRAATSAGTYEVTPVNGWMRGVALPAGEFSVRFEFRPRSVGVGAVVSVVTLLGVAVALLKHKRGALNPRA